MAACGGQNPSPFAGIGFKKPIALAWDMLSFEGEEIRVNLDKDFLKQIPAYDETHQVEIR